MMNIAANEEYKVLVTHSPSSKPNGQQWHWRATVLGFPDLVEEAGSREQVLQQIQSRIGELLRQAEIVTVTAPAPTEETDVLRAQGWDDHGLFKNDPEALQLFDEIEEERDRHLVGTE